MTRNLITDVAGLKVGQADDPDLASGVTVIVFDEPAVASVDVRGGAPGTRETDLLSPERTVAAVDAIVLSGGSAFGLDAASGVVAALAEGHRGFAVGGVRVPIVPAAILFDLLNGGDKSWGRYPPYRELGYEAARRASIDFALGTAGAGYGATTATLKGGLGSASVSVDGHIVGAIVAVNALGTLMHGDGPHFLAGALERGGEFGGRGLPSAPPPPVTRTKSLRPENTTIALVATDAILTKQQLRHVAAMAQAGLARAIHPVHTPLDGDVVFAASTGRRVVEDGAQALIGLGAAAADVLARACARAVFEARALPFPDSKPAWRDLYG